MILYVLLIVAHNNIATFSDYMSGGIYQHILESKTVFLLSVYESNKII